MAGVRYYGLFHGWEDAKDAKDTKVGGNGAGREVEELVERACIYLTERRDGPVGERQQCKIGDDGHQRGRLTGLNSLFPRPTSQTSETKTQEWDGRAG